MSYTVEDLDKFVTGGWDASYVPYHKAGTPPPEPVHYRAEGWRNLRDAIDYSGNVVEAPFGTIRYEDNFGGEGRGDQYWLVVSVTDPEGNVRRFKRNGWYASYDGGHYDGPTSEVRSEQKVIDVWVDV